MADKSFGVKELNLLNASGTPTITSPNNLNLNANTVAISTSVTVGQNLTVSANAGIASLNVTGIATIAQPANSNPMANWTITNNSASAYRFTGPGQSGSDDNPDLYLVRGHRYIFKHNATSSHPIQIRVSNGGSAYTDGVTYSNTGNNTTTDGNNLIINLQHDAPARLFYQCTAHGGMVGNIYTVGGPQVISGVVTATSFSGDGSNLTGISAGTSLSGSTNNTVCTVTGANAIQGEANVQIDSGGRLSVGNSQASTQYDQSNDLVIGNTTGSHGMTIISANDNRGRIMFSDTYSANTGRYAGQMLYDHQTETINWYSNYTNNGEVAMQLGGDQHQLFVGIDKGSTTTYNNRSAYFHRGTDNFISITGASNHVAGIVFGDTIAANGGNYETYMHHTNSTNDFWIRVNQGNDNRHLKITQAGNVEIGNGNLVMASGHGIDFSATGNISGTSSELLDDYEEGSWTPVVGGWDTFTPYSGSSYYSGWYVKVGTMVHCGWKIYIQHLTTVSSSAHVRISGLPFSSKSVSAGPVAAPVRFDIPEFGMSGYNLTYLGGNDTVLYMYKHVNGGGHLVAINAAGNRSNLWTMGTATYTTDS